MKTATLMTMVALMAAPLVCAADEQKDIPLNLTAQPAPQAAAPAAPEAQSGEAPGGCPSADWLNVETITLAAANGDPLAQYTLAWLTETGTTASPADPAAADELYAAAVPGLQKAAEKGHRAACMALASMYARGKGVTADAEKAAHYAEKAHGCRPAKVGKAPCCAPCPKDAAKPCCDKPCKAQPCDKPCEGKACDKPCPDKAADAK